MSVCVAVVNGIVVAVCKQILRSGTAVVDKAICADKPPKLRAIVPAIEVVKPCFGVIVEPPVAEGILVAHGVAGGVGDGAVAPGVHALGDEAALAVVLRVLLDVLLAAWRQNANVILCAYCQPCLKK